MRHISILIFGLIFGFLHSINAQSGCVSGHCRTGKGTYVFTNGSKYIGDFVHSLPHGKGTYTYKNGNVYQGDYVKGLKQGKGKMTFSNGDKYIGAFEKDIIAGFGKMTFRNNDMYQGDWFDGKAHGNGTYQFADGDKYIGGFIAGEFSGLGNLMRLDGSTFQGTWLHNKKHGEGIATDNNGNKVTQIYKENKLQIKEHSAQESNSTATLGPVRDCTDQYCDGINGKYVYGDGSIYVGGFLKGEAAGQGICYYVNGDRYEGGWSNHSPDGKGTMYFSNGNTYAALWDLGVPTKKILEESKSNTIKPKIDKVINNDPGETKIYALIVGIASYNHLQSLKYTDDDAYQLYAFLKSPEGGAIPDGQIKILIDDAATHDAITREIRNIAEMADQNDVILLYTSGHGLDGAFVPSDFNGYQNQLPYDDVLTLLNASRAKHKLYIVDACHSGSMAVAARSPFNISLQNFYNAYNTIQGGTAIVMSSKKEEVSLEYGGLRQGVFSHFLIKGLKGDADTNHDKIIDISELYEYVSVQVKQYTNASQHPQIMGDYDVHMPVGMIR